MNQAKPGSRSFATRYAFKRLRELPGADGWPANYCGFESIDSERTALVIAGLPFLVELAGRLVERMIERGGLALLDIGRTDGGPRSGYSRVFVLLVRSDSVTDRMRRQLETLTNLQRLEL